MLYAPIIYANHIYKAESSKQNRTWSKPNFVMLSCQPQRGYRVRDRR